MVLFLRKWYILVFVCGFVKPMTFVCISHQHPLAQLSIHQDVLWHKCGYKQHECVAPGPLRVACYYGRVSV